MGSNERFDLSRLTGCCDPCAGTFGSTFTAYIHRIRGYHSPELVPHKEVGAMLYAFTRTVGAMLFSFTLKSRGSVSKCAWRRRMARSGRHGKRPARRPIVLWRWVQFVMYYAHFDDANRWVLRQVHYVNSPEGAKDLRSSLTDNARWANSVRQRLHVWAPASCNALAADGISISASSQRSNTELHVGSLYCSYISTYLRH